MPLLDHFHPPLSTELPWESFLASWVVKLADALMERGLPAEYRAEEIVPRNPTTAMPPAAWGGPAPALVFSAIRADTFEVRVISTAAGPRLVAAIELISPGNKDRAEERRAFAVKCASYLYQGISLIIVDVVTNRRANLPQRDHAHHGDGCLHTTACQRPALRGGLPPVASSGQGRGRGLAGVPCAGADPSCAAVGIECRTAHPR